MVPRKKTANPNHKQPENVDQLIDRIILDYGKFGVAMKFLKNLLETEFNGSLILGGQEQVGKKTLLTLVANQSGMKLIVLNPFEISNDFEALTRIAQSLEINNQSSEPKLMREIERVLSKCERKVIIALIFMEEFCSQRQPLLYNLTTLVQHAKNVVMIGVTSVMTCLDNLEKRVRSRLEATTYRMALPYESVEEYLEFASILLGGIKFERETVADLGRLYLKGYKSPRSLKTYLGQVCQWDEKGVLKIRGQPSSGIKRKVACRDFDLTFSNLTVEQQELAKLVCFYCKENDTQYFRLKDVQEFARCRGLSNFNASCPERLHNASVLLDCQLFSAAERQYYKTPLSAMTKMSLGFTISQLKSLAKIAKFRSIKTDNIWKKL